MNSVAIRTDSPTVRRAARRHLRRVDPVMRRLIGRALAAILLAAALDSGCSAPTVAHAPTYTQVELAAICERNGGWWRGDDLMGGFCEYEGPQP